MGTTALRGNLSVLRAWHPEDAPSLSQHANNRAVWRNLGDAFPHPYTLDQAEEYIEARRAQDGPQRIFAIEVDGAAVGGIGFQRGHDVRSRSADFGYWLGETYWGRGIATDAGRLVVAYAFETFPLNRLQAQVKAWNPASARVLEKLGFTLECRLREHVFKDGAFVDELVYGLLRHEFEAGR
jgi:RimJ/RimL family protein N-acetyltransferase